MRNPTRDVPVVWHDKSIVFNGIIVVGKKRHLNDYAIQKKKERMEIQINLCSHLSELNACNDFNRLTSTPIARHKTFVRISFMVVLGCSRNIPRKFFFLSLIFFKSVFFLSEHFLKSTLNDNNK